MSVHRQPTTLLIGIITALMVVTAVHAAPSTAASKEHKITIDSTMLVPISWWYVPGVTPSIYNSDPESMDAHKTSERKTIILKPGQYKFVSFTFDFPFIVNLDGTLEFSNTLNQCVHGRGTKTLAVLCKRTYPYGGSPEYK